MPSLIDAKIVFPDEYDFSDLQAFQCSGEAPDLSLSLSCETIPDLKNVVIFTGFSSSGQIPKGTTVTMYLDDITNPDREIVTETLQFFIRE